MDRASIQLATDWFYTNGKTFDDRDPLVSGQSNYDLSWTLWRRFDTQAGAYHFSARRLPTNSGSEFTGSLPRDPLSILDVAPDYRWTAKVTLEIEVHISYLLMSMLIFRMSIFPLPQKIWMKPYYEPGNFIVSAHLPSSDCRTNVAYPHHDHSGSGYLRDSPRSELPPNAQSAHSDHIRRSGSSGRKRALCIGINYRGKSNELYGCIQDAKDIRAFLMKNGYRDKDIRMLTDETDNIPPTKVNILKALSWLVDGAGSDDSLFIHYSGHGSQVVDTDGDEVDEKDEVIECIGQSFISDDELHEKLKSLPCCCRLTTLFDTNILSQPRHLDCSELPLRDDLGGQRERAVPASVLDSISADVICWSGTRDNQTGADTRQGGVMTRAFIEAFQESNSRSYKEFLHSIRISIVNSHYN
ncbi:caspase domain-containing protein [Armillaria mellea]|nr:caspase domain-containing protein [Armillaria mellea]